MPEQVSDRPARTPRVVLAVASHDSLRVRFLLTAGCKFGLIPKKQISSTTSHTAGGSFLHGHTLVFCLFPCFPGLGGGGVNSPAHNIPSTFVREFLSPEEEATLFLNDLD